MSRRLRLAIGLVTIFTVALIALGTAVPKNSNPPVKSPYMSALANVGVGTAEAAPHKCRQNCEAVQGIPRCSFEGFSKCAVANGVCTETPCGH